MLMKLPTPFYEVLLWIAVIDIILLFTLEILSPYYGRTNITIDKIKLRQIVRATTLLVIIVTFWILQLHL